MSLEWSYVYWIPIAMGCFFVVFFGGQALERYYEKLSLRFSTTTLSQARVSKRGRRFRWFFLALGLACLGLALADPRYGIEVEEVHQRGRDVFFVLDVSRSMLASDIAPTRLKRSKADIIDGVRRMSGHRLGLIIFAGQPKEVCPLTYDHGHFIQRLRDVSPSSVPMGGTNIGDALRLALDSIDAGANLGHHRDIILITDGQDLTGYYEEISKRAGSEKVSIYTVGIGTTTPTSIRLADGTFVESEGKVVQTALNSEPLQEISILSGGGFYQNLTAAPDWLPNILKVIEQKEQALQSSLKNQHKTPRYPAFLLLAMALWALAILVPERRFKESSP